jgi:signal transduction histidine kinase
MKLLKILIVDDKADWTIPFTENLETIPLQELAGNGFDRYEFRVAQNQAEADQAVREAGPEGYHFVFLDLRYPLSESEPLDDNEEAELQGMKWLPTLRHLLPHATIIVLTNYPDTETLQDIVSSVREHHADDFIPKTQEFDDIVPRIRVAHETAQRMHQLLSVEREFFSLLRTRAARSQTYAEDVAALLGQAKSALQRIAQRIEGGDASAIASAARGIRGELEYLGKEFDELTYVLNKGQEHLAEVDVAAETRLMMYLYQRLIEEAEVELIAPEVAQGIPLKSYASDLKVALHEVITNALESLRLLPTGGKGRKLKVRVEKIGEDAVIRVADNGAGFCNEAMEHMFERGFTTRGDKHQGLGLYIAKRMMNQIGGDIEVQNAPDGGAVVCLTVKNLGDA